MIEAQSTLLILLVILAVSLIVPELFKKLRIPFVTSLILIGAILGPYGLKYVEFDSIISFFGFLGMTFLMFMAGLETDLSKVKKLKSKIFFMALLNGLIPFIVGISLTKAFGYSWYVSLLIGVIFVSSSVAVVIPSLKSAGLFHRNIGQLILSAVLIADMVSLILLSFVLQGASPITKLPLIIYFLIIIASFAVIFTLIPKLANYWIHRSFNSKTHYEKQVRFIILIVIAILAYFLFLGVHPILAAFIIGITLSGVIRHEHIFNKFYTLGYGLFVPIFFFIVGMEMNLGIFKNFTNGLFIIIGIILALILSKFFSGLLAGKLVKLSTKDSAIFGASSIIQLTTTLAVVYAASELGLLDTTLITAIIALSIVTTVIGPIILKVLIKPKELV